MTREKAKEIISYHKILVDRDKSGLLDKQLEYQAIDMAIEALKQQTTTKNDLGVDCVSRKAVINQIFYSTDNNGDVVLGSALRERIARLPSVTPQVSNTWSLEDVREDFMSDVYNTLDFLPTNDEANRIIDSFDRVTSSIKQEPFINKLCVSSGVCEHDKNVALDKIKAEMEELDARYVIGDYGIYGENSPKYVPLQDVLEIIDKYKAEVRDKHGRYRISN